MKLLDEKGLTTVWAAIKNTFTSKSDADGKYAKKADLADYAKKNKLADELSITPHESQANFTLLDIDGIEICDTVLQRATSTQAGVMTSADKNKLDGISSGANNYKLPVASTTALGGIKTNYVPKSGDTLFKVNTDTEGNANTYIPGLIYGTDEYLSEIEFAADSYEHTSFNGKDFNSYDQEGTNKCTISLPDKDGTLALTSDIPDVSSLCKFNSANALERCVYGRINLMSPIAEELNLDSILHKDGIIIFANPSTVTNITCSEGFIYNGDYIDNNKKVEPGLFIITIDAGVPLVLSL